jgi:hypothetical protein
MSTATPAKSLTLYEIDAKLALLQQAVRDYHAGRPPRWPAPTCRVLQDELLDARLALTRTQETA